MSAGAGLRRLRREAGEPRVRAVHQFLDAGVDRAPLALAVDAERQAGILVAKDVLDGTDVDAAGDEVGGGGAPARVGADVLRRPADVSLVGELLGAADDGGEHALAHRMTVSLRTLDRLALDFPLLRGEDPNR